MKKFYTAIAIAIALALVLGVFSALAVEPAQAPVVMESTTVTLVGQTANTVTYSVTRQKGIKAPNGEWMWRQRFTGTVTWDTSTNPDRAKWDSASHSLIPSCCGVKNKYGYSWQHYLDTLGPSGWFTTYKGRFAWDKLFLNNVSQGYKLTGCEAYASTPGTFVCY